MRRGKPAVILAAGKGRRLEELSLKKPKPMINVTSDESLIERLIKQLIDNGIEQIVVVVGYYAEKMKAHLKRFDTQVGITFVENPDFETTNNIYSLWLARNHLENGFLLLEADIYCENEIVRKLVDSIYDNCMVIDKYSEDMDGTVVSVDQDNTVTGMYLKRHQHVSFDYSDKYKTVNFYSIGEKIAKEFFLERIRFHIENKDVNSYYELIVLEALETGYAFHAVYTNGAKWYEIDTKEDLLKTRSIFGF